MSDTIQTVLIVDDHPITRQGLSLLIDSEPDLSVCGEAETARAALEAVKRLTPDLVLIDVSLPDKSGIELIKDILCVSPDQRSLVLSMHDEEIYAERALRAGAKGYVMKDAGGAKIMDAIRQSLRGEIAVSQAIAASILSGLARANPKDRKDSPIGALTDREFEVFEMLGRGKTAKEVAADLGISAKTVEAHRSRIREKMNFRNSQELVHYAIRWVESN